MQNHKSFWKRKPLVISDNTPKQILSNEELLAKISLEITNNKLQLDYKIVNKINLADKTTDNIDNYITDFTEFINKNYISSDDDNFKLFYSENLIKFATNNSMIIAFYPKGKNTPVGYIVGKKNHLSINNEIKDFLEVNFLCITPKLRNLALAPYMINVLTKESILNYNIGVAHYTIYSKIKSPYFSKKLFYHRMFNIKHLVNTGFLDSNADINLYEKIYNTFSYPINFKNNHKIHSNLDFEFTDDTIKQLYDSFMIYSKNTFKIYEVISFDEFKNTFHNNSFTHFIIKDNQDKIISYVSMFNLDTRNINNNTNYKNGYYYYMFFDNETDITNTLELIHEYIHLHNIYDVSTLSDMFNVNYNNTKFIPGTGLLRYYLFNMETNLIPNFQNGLITI